MMRIVHCDFTDGHAIRSNAMFVSDQDSLKVMLFQDSFEIANPLESAKQKHNILAVYFTYGNFHPDVWIKYSWYYVQKKTKCFDVNKVFTKVVSDLCELQTKGISFEGKLYRGTVACIIWAPT